MTYHILILTSPYLTQYIEDTLKHSKIKIRYKIVEYDSFSQLKDLYLAHEKWADGVLTSGAVVKRVLELAVDHPLKPIVALGTDTESFYRIPLSLIVDNRALDPERIIFDTFISMMPNSSVLNLLESKSMAEIFGGFARWLEEVTLEDLYSIEDRTYEIIKKKWDAKEIELVICRFGSLMDRLKELSIPCVFATSTDEHLFATLQSLLSSIKVQKITAHSPAVVAICPSNVLLFNDRMERQIEEILTQFGAENDLALIIQKKKGLILILTEKAVVTYLTEHLRGCRLTPYLTETMGQPVTVCYGIGNTVDEAIKNSKIALKASGFSHYPYLVDEDLNVIGPLGVLQPLVPEDEVSPLMKEVASKAGLAINTVQRLFRLTTLLDRKEITGRELAESFHITSRGANRILEKLEACGLATVSVDRNTHLKGRPSKIYHLNWDD